MKNWFSIGPFAKKVRLTERAIRLYEKAGLITAHTRGENKYRYYTEEQIERVERVKQFKSFGFTIAEIKLLLEVDAAMNPEKLKRLLEDRLRCLQAEQVRLSAAEQVMRKVLTSLDKNKTGLGPTERRFIMSQLDKVCVVVAGLNGLEATANYITHYIAAAGKKVPVTLWDGRSPLPNTAPYIIVLPEEHLKKPEVEALSPDIVVIKEISTSSSEIHAAYLQLYKTVGPDMTTVLNADDKAVVEFAHNETLRKGKTYYFSKNAAMESQIRRIGGAICQGERIEVFGMNQSSEAVEIKLNRVLSHVEEVAYLASIVAVMDFGLRPEHIEMP